MISLAPRPRCIYGENDKAEGWKHHWMTMVEQVFASKAKQGSAVPLWLFRENKSISVPLP